MPAPTSSSTRRTPSPSSTGTLTFGDLVQEKARIIRTEQGVTDLTERLKKKTKQQFDRFLGQAVLNLALKQVSSTNGFKNSSGDLNGFLANVDQSLTKAIGKISGVGGGILDDVIDDPHQAP